MKSKETIENKIKKDLSFTAGETLQKRILNDVLNTHQRFRQNKSSKEKLNIWRMCMKNKISKIASAAVILFAVALSITIIDRLTTPAWAFGQTLKAIKGIQSIVIKGTYDNDSTPKPFTFWIRFSDSENELFDMRFECEEQIIVINNQKAWVYFNEENTVKIYEDVTASYGMMRDLGFWYTLSKEHPWISGKLLSSIKRFADSWQETYGKDERTGRESVFVTCGFEKLSVSLWFVCDIETKLITEGKYWNLRRTNMDEPPKYYATSFTYDEKINDDTFEFRIPEGAKIILSEKKTYEQNPAQILFDEAENLFHKEKKYAEALELYKQVYEKYPNLNNGTYGENALMMIGICYGWLGQRDKAIEVFLKDIKEYGHLEGYIESTYFYLGCAYLDEGQKEKALEAFENCLKHGEGVRDPDKFPLKNAREGIEKLKN